MRFIMFRMHKIFSIKALLVLSFISFILAVISFRSRSDPRVGKHIRSEFKSELVDRISIDSSAGTKQACVQPTLDQKDLFMMKQFKKFPPLKCQGAKDLVYVDNGTLRFHSPKPAGTKCDMYPLVRGKGDYNVSFGAPVKDVSNGTQLASNFFKIKCSQGDKTVYENIHLGMCKNSTLKKRLSETKPPANGLGLSVALLGFDSMSRMSWFRRMPHTRDYFVNTLGAIELEGYNIMGDGTPAAMFPILTGKHEQELPEARRNFKGAKPCDNFPWIWKDFQKNGYVTSWADAEVNIAPFNYRLLGFEHPPTDFFMRPFYLAVNPTYGKYTKHCHGSTPKHHVWFNYFRDIFHMYKNDPKFMVHFYATLSHDDNNPITMADDDLKNLLKDLNSGGHLENTMLILMADHGARYAKLRGTLNGKLEERMPYFAIRLPESFAKSHPNLVQNLRTNSKRFSTPMDIHETFKDMIKFDGAGLGDVNKRGISLFKEIPLERTCAHAGVAPHWCSCMAWVSVNVTDELTQKALKTAVDTINGFTEAYRNDCAKLSHGDVTLASKMAVNADLLRFKQTTGDRGLKPVMLDKGTKQSQVFYQLTFYTEPGHGQFEVTVEHSLKDDQMSINPKAISRVNKYGNDPACVLGKNREIRQYCYCNDNLKKNQKPT